MTKLEAIQTLPRESNIVTEAMLWLIAMSLAVAVVWYACIRLSDLRWRKRVKES